MHIKAASENGQHQLSKVGAIATELEETKQSLEKAKEEGQFMEYCLASLKQDLEQTKKELQQLKARESQKQLTCDGDPEIEELKFMENASQVQPVEPQNEDVLPLEYQRKRSVKFASPPLLAKVIVSRHVSEQVVVASPNSLKQKAKSKPLIPLISGIFSKKKGSQEVEPPREPHKRGR